MKPSLIPSIFPIILLFIHSLPLITLARTHENFLQCLSYHQYPNITSINPKLIYTPKNTTSYFDVLNYSIRNPRFDSPSTPKPLVIVTPSQISHVQTTIICAKKYDIQIRIRSGGHDYEGLSYVSIVPFVILDLINIRSIDVDVQNRLAWIESGATIGDIYYRIAEKSLTLGFPAGVCHTVGVGGHFSGGGYGTMLRKYGLAADQVVDALVVNTQGQVLDRKSMGEDMFWAIRGGGGASYGVILSWKVRLVPVPPIVTVFTVEKNLSQNVTQLVHRWQQVADKLHEDLFIRLIIQAVKSTDRPGGKTIKVSFNSLFLGGIDRLIPLMQEGFPELGLKREDCMEMSWIESILYFDGFQGQPLEILLDRLPEPGLSYKAKSDYVTQPISMKGLEGIWEKLFEEEAGRGILIMSPYGGKMNEISESEIPFPHRVGNIYKIQYLIYWEQEANVTVAQMRIGWIRKLFRYMTPYVSKNPRSAYINYRDLDVGTNNNKGTTSYAQASIWGYKYFKNNFNKLVYVKTIVDPTNFFRNEQSIPSLSSVWKKRGH